MALHNISVPFANLLGLTLSSLLYGIYLVLFLVYIYLGINGTIARNAAGGTHSTISRRVVKAMKTPIFLASLALFFTATGTWILTIYRNFRGWIPSDGGPANPSVFFDANADISETIQNALDALSLLIGDAMIVSFVHSAIVLSGALREDSQIYRLWAVWPDWRILAPVLISFTGLIISLIITIVNTTRISVISQDVGITAISVFELLTTLYCTLFISFKIYNVASASASSAVGERTLTYFLAIFAESAAAYTAWILLYALLHWINLNLQFSIFVTIPSVLGATNALINTRVALGRAVDSRNSQWARTSSTQVQALPVHFAPRRWQNDGGTGTGLGATIDLGTSTRMSSRIDEHDPGFEIKN